MTPMPDDQSPDVAKAMERFHRRLREVQTSAQTDEGQLMATPHMNQPYEGPIPPACCTPCRHLDHHVGDGPGPALYSCVLGLMFPIRKQACARQRVHLWAEPTQGTP
jgi:hypothetical protein